MCSTGDVTGYRVSMVMRCLIAAKEEQKTRLEEDVEELENALTKEQRTHDFRNFLTIR